MGASISEVFKVEEGSLLIEGLKLADLAKDYGTPLLVTSERRLKDNCRRLYSAFRKHYGKLSVNYAVKSNPNPSIIRVLSKEGVGVDTASPAEIELASLAGVKKEHMLFSPNYAPASELNYAFERGITINFDDIGQFESLAKYGVPKCVSFRLNPGVGKGAFPGIVTAGPEVKFGIPASHIEKAYKIAKQSGVQKFGMHMMAGSNVLDPQYFSAITARILDVVGDISQRLDIDFDFIDIGGGFGVPYKPDEKPLDIEKVAKMVCDTFKDRCRNYNLGTPKLMMEPGRYLVADSTVLLGTVNYIKNYDKMFVGTDVGMNTLIRPALYGAYHEVGIVNKMREKSTVKASVTGQMCESTDVIAQDRLLPPPVVGDTVGFFTAGAYVFTMSSQYGSRPRPAEVLVSETGRTRIIRRRETVADLRKNLAQTI